MFYLPLSLFNFISLLIFFYSLLHNFIIFPPQCFYSLLHNFYYFPSSMFFIPLLHLHLHLYLLISIVFSPPPPPPHFYCFLSTTTTTTTATFLLFSLHHHRHISIVFPPFTTRRTLSGFANPTYTVCGPWSAQVRDSLGPRLFRK